MKQKICNTYRDMLQLMYMITGKAGSPEWIFWGNVCELIESSEVIEKNDCIGMIARMLDENSGFEQSVRHAVYGKEQSQYFEEYLRMIEEYTFAGSYSELGSYWKFLLATEDMDRLEDLNEWLYLFHKEILPVIDQVLADWNYINNPKTSEEIKDNNKKVYTAIRRKLNDCKKSLDRAVELYRLKEQFHYSK